MVVFKLKVPPLVATGFVFGSLTSGTTITLTNVIGSFTTGEKLIASDSAETGKLIENSGNTDIAIGSSSSGIELKDLLT